MAKKSHTRGLSLLFVLLCVGIKLSKTEGVTYVKTGDTYSFKPNPDIKTKPYTILWKFKSDKLVEFEDGMEDWFQFKNQGNLKTETGVLTLSRMTELHNGQYESEIVVDSSGKTLASNYQIKVIDPVGEPKITCTNKGNATLLECSLNPEVGQVTFTWKGPNNKEFSGKTVTTDVKDPKATFYCTAENPVGTNSTEISLEKCNPEVIGSNIGPIVGGVLVAVALIGALGGGGAVIWRKNKGEYSTQKQADAEKGAGQPLLPMENTTNPNNCSNNEPENPNNTTPGNTEDEDLESPKTGGQEVPGSNEQNSTLTTQGTLLGDQSGKADSNGGCSSVKDQGNIDSKQSGDEGSPSGKDEDIGKSAEDDADTPEQDADQDIEQDADQDIEENPGDQPQDENTSDLAADLSTSGDPDSDL